MKSNSIQMELAAGSPEATASAKPASAGRRLGSNDPAATTPPLEQVFQETDAALAASGKAAAALAKTVKTAVDAAKGGNVRALSKAVQNAQAALADVQPGLQRANQLLETDFATALRSGAFADEVVRLAERAGLAGVRHIQGAVLSFPVALFPKPDTLSVRYGKKASGSLRPSAVVAQLQELRKHKRAASALRRFVDAIEHQYLTRTQNRLGVPVPIQAIYEMLTPLPGQRDEYTEIDFVAALYALERDGALTSSGNHRLSFPASTSTKFKKSIRIATEEGEERLYSSLRFDKR